MHLSFGISLPQNEMKLRKEKKIWPKKVRALKNIYMLSFGHPFSFFFKRLFYELPTFIVVKYFKETNTNHKQGTGRINIGGIWGICEANAQLGGRAN